MREESASSRHTLDIEIDQFRFEEEGAPERPVELSDFEHESNRFSIAHPLKLIVARVNTSSEIEEEGMDLKPRSGLKGLLANKNKGSTLKEVPKTQVSTSLPLPPPPPSTDLELKAIPNLRNKRPVEDLEEGEVGPQKGAKQQKKGKDPHDKRAKSVESRDEAEVRRGQRSWAPRLEEDGASIPWDATIWESQKGYAIVLTEALEQLLLLPRDMEGLRRTRQLDLFMSLKRDLVMVSQSTLF